MKIVQLLLILIFCSVSSIVSAQDCKSSKKIVKKAKKHLVDDQVEKATKFKYLFSKFSHAAGTSIVKSDKEYYLNLVLSREMGKRVDINKSDPLVIQFQDDQVVTLYPDRDTPGKFTLPVTTEVSRAYYILSKEQLEIMAAQSIRHVKVYFTSDKISDSKFGEDDLGKFFDYEILKERFQNESHRGRKLYASRIKTMETTIKNQLLSKMKVETFIATILGLLTVGIYWVFLLKKWLVKNQEYKEAFYNTIFKVEDSQRLSENVAMRTAKNLKYANIIGIMLSIGLVVFLIEMVVELILNARPLFEEEPFFFYVWLTFSLFGLWLHSIVLQLRNTWLDEKEIINDAQYEKPWLLRGEGKRIYIMAILNVILALGLLPFIIFPPLVGSAINGYVEIESER